MFSLVSSVFKNLEQKLKILIIISGTSSWVPLHDSSSLWRHSCGLVFWCCSWRSSSNSGKEMHPDRRLRLDLIIEQFDAIKWLFYTGAPRSSPVWKRIFNSCNRKQWLSFASMKLTGFKTSYCIHTSSLNWLKTMKLDLPAFNPALLLLSWGTAKSFLRQRVSI